MAEETSPEDSAEVLLSKAKKGASAESARDYIGDILWARLWRSVTALVHSPPDLSSLLMYRSEISACMKIAQDMQMDLANAEVAVKKVKELFTAKPKI